jgi:hypothetical protein
MRVVYIYVLRDPREEGRPPLCQRRPFFFVNSLQTC